MKKLVLTAIVAAGALLAMKKAKASQSEQTSWADATDPVK